MDGEQWREKKERDLMRDELEYRAVDLWAEQITGQEVVGHGEDWQLLPSRLGCGGRFHQKSWRTFQTG